LCTRAEVKQWMEWEGQNATSKSLNNLLLSLGIKSQVPCCLQDSPIFDMFAGDAEQYGLLQSYVEILNGKGHLATLEQDAFHTYLFQCLTPDMNIM